MAKVVNLRRARKDKAKSEARRKADANAALHGRSKSEKGLEEARGEQATRRLDGHKLEDDQ